ncbi:MAG: hypothetical protein GXP24_07240 [Planctomycetes bacterium]|nr:hypothetical protein [Planctomycetota bacterium]
MEFTLAVLLVSSLTCVGLLALWAATSQRHWFARVAVFVGALALLLLVPAYEPVVAFALQGAVVAAGIHAARFFCKKNPSDYRRFSLASLLQVMVFVAITAAVVAKLPTLNFRAWQSVLLIGGCSGLATLVGYWVVYGQKIRWGWRLLWAFVLVYCIAVPLVLCDWFVFSTTGYFGWPPESIPGMAAGIFGGVQEDDPVTLWIPVILAIAILMSCIVWLAVGILANLSSSTGVHTRWQPVLRAYSLLVLTVLLLIPSAVVYYQLMTPLPIPEQNLPADNGYLDLYSGGQIAEKWAFNTTNYDADAAPDKELRAAVAEMKSAYDKLHVGLGKEIRIPIDYHSPEGFGMDAIQAMRSLARSTSGRGQLAVRENRIEDAVEDYLDNVRLGYAIRPDTLMVDALVGIAINGIGQHGLYELRAKLDWDQSARIISLLQRFESECEPAEAFIHRDRVWEQHALGWHGHLTQILSNISDNSLRGSNEALRSALQTERAKSKLLCVELALLTFRGDQGNFPRKLDELVPKYLAVVPVDPFDLDSGPLRYRREEDKYVLYSLGWNGRDDGGVLPADYEGSGPAFWHMEEGDLRLELLFAPDPPVKEKNKPTDESKAQQ